MTQLLHSEAATGRFTTLDGTPDATPVVEVYAGTTLLGTATVTLVSTGSYGLTYTLPSSGIAANTRIWGKVDYAVATVAVASQWLLLGELVVARPNTITPLDASGTLSAIGLSSANLDAQLADLPTVAEFNARTLLASDYFNSTTDNVILNTTQYDTIIEEITNLASSQATTISRTSSDTTPIRFVFTAPGQTLTGTKSINGATPVAVTGTITEVETGLSGDWYQLNYNSADRASAGDFVVYKFTDGITTKTVLLTISPTIRTKEEDEVVDQNMLSEISTAIEELETLIQNLNVDVDVDLNPLLEAIQQINTKISSPVVNVISPVGDDGITLTVIQGDDYLSIDGRNILFTGDIENQWVDLTNSEVVFGVYGTSVLKGCVVISGTGIQQISLELTSEDTNIPQGTYDYDVQTTLSNGSVITLFRGKLISIKSYTN
jgi:hypothetical protein